MIKPAKISLVSIATRIPSDLKKAVSEYCNRNGIKMQFFLTEALRKGLLEMDEDTYDNAIIDQRRKKPEYVSEVEMDKYFEKRKKSG